MSDNDDTEDFSASDYIDAFITTTFMEPADTLVFPDDISEDKKRAELEKYFEYDSEFNRLHRLKKYGLISCAVLFLIVASFEAWQAVFLSFLPLLVLLKKLTPVICDKQFLKWRSIDLTRVVNESLKKAAIHEKDLLAKPFQIISSPDDAGDVATKKISDPEIESELGSFTYNPINVFFLFELEKQIMTYSVDYDIVENKIIKEIANEFFYKDIVSIATGTHEDSLSESTYNAFTLTNSGGVELTVPLSTPDDQGTYQTLITNDVDKMIFRIRQNVRKFKD